MFENRTDKETFVFPSNFCWPFPSHPQQTDLSLFYVHFLKSSVPVAPEELTEN